MSLTESIKPDPMKGKTVIEVITSLLIVLFLYATLIQVVFHNTFQSQLTRALPGQSLAIIISYTLPVLQVLLAYLLWRPATRLTGLCVSLAAISCFTVYLVIMLPVANRSYCRCGETWSTATLGTNILINLAIILVIGTAIILAGRQRNNSPGFS